MMRSILAVLTGFVTWFVVATLINFLIRAMLVGYVAAEPTMAFTLPMMIARLGAGVVSSLAAGFACSAVARGNVAPGLHFRHAARPVVSAGAFQAVARFPRVVPRVLLDHLGAAGPAGRSHAARAQTPASRPA